MKLLIVDDESPARERLRRLLAELDDCEVVGEADNGEQALASCGELQPDVVLLDVRMPGLSGIQVARHIDSLEDPPAIIFTTSVTLAMIICTPIPITRKPITLLRALSPDSPV